MAKKPKKKPVTKADAKRLSKIDPIVKGDRRYKDLDYIAAPKDVKEQLKSLYKKRKRAAKKSGKKFVPPTLKDVPKKYKKVLSNEGAPRYYMYWDLNSRLLASESESFNIIGLDGISACKGCNLASAVQAVNAESRIIDSARDILRDSGKRDEYPTVPFIIFRKKIFRKGMKTIMVKVDFSEIEASNELKSIIKSLLN